MDISGVTSINWSALGSQKNQNRQNLPGNIIPRAAPSSLTAAPKAQDNTMQEFTDYMKQTPAQRMQASWLAQHGITKEQFDALPAEEKQKLLAQMKQEIETKIKQSMEQKPTNILA